jgi:hypothetical protein
MPPSYAPAVGQRHQRCVFSFETTATTSTKYLACSPTLCPVSDRRQIKSTYSKVCANHPPKRCFANNRPESANTQCGNSARTPPNTVHCLQSSMRNSAVCVKCFICKRSPGQTPYGAKPACAKRAAYPDPPSSPQPRIPRRPRCKPESESAKTSRPPSLSLDLNFATGTFCKRKGQPCSQPLSCP